MSTTIVRGGDVVLPDGVRRLDVRLADGRIAALGSLHPDPGDDVVDAGGLLVLPGLVDCHTHFGIARGEMAARDDFTNGSMSAAAGGVTTFINFVPQLQRQSFLEALRTEHQRAARATVVDYGFHLSMGTPPTTWASELPALVEEGVSSIKVYTTYRDTPYYTRDHDWLALMRMAAFLGITVMVHAENDDLVRGATEDLLASGKRSLDFHAMSRPAVAEVEAVARGLVFASETGCRVYFVHLSDPRSVSLVARARRRGVSAFAETCPHYLSLDDSMYAGVEPERYVMTPPLRPPAAVGELVAHVLAGRIDTLGTDHCGYSLDQRGRVDDFTRTAPGIPGVETLWPVAYTTLVVEHGMPVAAAAALVSQHPAEVFGLTDKGRLTPGNDADLVLFDPHARYVLDEATLHSNAGFSPWHGRPLHGRVVRTLCRGRTVFDDGDVIAEPGYGRYVASRVSDY